MALKSLGGLDYYIRPDGPFATIAALELRDNNLSRRFLVLADGVHDFTYLLRFKCPRLK